MRCYSSESLFEGLVLFGKQLNDVFGGVGTTNLVLFQTEDVMELLKEALGLEGRLFLPTIQLPKAAVLF